MDRITPEEFARRLQAGATGLVASVNKSLLKLALKGEAAAKRNASNSPKVRSGRLRQSIRGEVAQVAQVVQISLKAGGTRDLTYVRTQEFGGVIRPRARKYLAIPLPTARTAAGVSRYASPRDLPGVFLIRSRAGNLILMHPQQGPLWVLKTEVRVPATQFIGKAFQSAILSALRNDLAQAVRSVLLEVKGG